MAGTLILCVIMVAVGFSTIQYVKQVSHQVSELTENLSLQMTLSRDIAAKTILARVHANAYVGEQTQQFLNDFIQNYRELNALIDTLEPMVGSSRRGPILEEIRTSVQAYGNAFTRVVRLIRHQQNILSNEMTPSGYRIDSRFSALRTGSPGENSLHQFLALGNAQMAWMEMVNHSIQYIQNKNERHAVLFNKYAISTKKNLATLVRLFHENSLERKNAEEAHNAVDKFSAGFEKIHKASIELNQLFKTTCRDLENKINKAVEASVTSIETEYKAQNIASQKILSKSWFLLFAAMVIALVLGTLISFFIATMVKNLRASHAEVQRYQNQQQELVAKKTAQLKETNTQLQKINQELNHEIDERKEAQDALQKNRQKLNLALQAAVMGIWQWEPATGTMILSGEHPALLGINKTMFKNTLEDFKTYIHPEDRENTENFLKAIASGKAPDCLTYRVVWPDGTIKWMQSHGKSIQDKTSPVHRIVGTTQDITQHIMAEQEHSEKKKLSAVMETAGAVCHELNQPLQIISGCCELLKDTKEANPEILRKLEMIDRQVQRMTTLNHNLMNITSYRTKAYLTSTIIDLNEASRKDENLETNKKRNTMPYS